MIKSVMAITASPYDLAFRWNSYICLQHYHLWFPLLSYTWEARFLVSSSTIFNVVRLGQIPYSNYVATWAHGKVVKRWPWIDWLIRSWDGWYWMSFGIPFYYSNSTCNIHYTRTTKQLNSNTTLIQHTTQSPIIILQWPLHLIHAPWHNLDVSTRAGLLWR